MTKIHCMQCDNEHEVTISDVFKDELGYGMQCHKVGGTCEIAMEDFLKVVSESGMYCIENVATRWED